MKIFLLIVGVILILVLGYIIMSKIDTTIKKNNEAEEKEDLNPTSKKWFNDIK